MHPIDLAIAATGVSQSEFARRLSARTAKPILTQHVNNWRSRGIPPEQAELIESVSGVRCEVLCPNYEWTRDATGRPFYRQAA